MKSGQENERRYCTKQCYILDIPSMEKRKTYVMIRNEIRVCYYSC